MSEIIRILVFGSKSNGKTSLINLLTRGVNFNPDFNEVRCTVEGREYIFTEMIAFDSNETGNLLEANAERKFAKFLKNKEICYHLAIQVKKRQPILETDTVNYDIVIKRIFREQIKSICVITFGEELVSLKDYWINNEHAFRQRGFQCDTGVTVCCGHSSNPVFENIFKGLRNDSYEILWNLITKMTRNAGGIQPTFSSLSRLIEVSRSFLTYIREAVGGSVAMDTNENEKIKSQIKYEIKSEFKSQIKSEIFDDSSFVESIEPNELDFIVLFLFGPDLITNSKFVHFLAKNQKVETNDDIFKFKFFLNDKKFLIMSVCYDDHCVNNSKGFLASLKRFRQNHATIFVNINACILLKKPQNLTNQSAKVIGMLRKYFQIGFDMISVVCNEEQIEKFHLLQIEEKEIVDFHKHGNLPVCACFLVQYPFNPKLDDICQKYRTNTQIAVWQTLQQCIQTKPQQINLRTLDINTIYFEMNWSNRVDLEGVNLDLNECALLSSSSKEEKESVQRLRELGWIEFYNSSSLLKGRSGCDSSGINFGYYGVTYFKKDLKQIILAIAHRGTQFNEIGNIIADLEIAEHAHPEIVNEALKYEEKVLENIASEFPNYTIKIVHVGFSLGGFIAAYCANSPLAQSNKRTNGVVKYGVTLDAPGILKNPISKRKNEQNNIVNYFITPNIVNTCNEHIGKKYQIQWSGIEAFKGETKLEIEYNNNIIANLTNSDILTEHIEHTYKSHNLDLLLDLTKNFIQLDQVEKWPIANNKMRTYENDNLIGFGVHISHFRNNQIVYTETLP